MDGLTQQDYENLLDICLSNGGEFADIYEENEELLSVVIENERIKSLRSGTDVGAHIRVIYKDKTFSAYTNNLAINNLKQLCLQLADGAEEAFTKEAVSVQPVRWTASIAHHVQLTDPDKILPVFFTSGKTLRSASPHIKQVTLSYYESLKQIKVVNSLGEYMIDDREYSRYAVSLVANDGNITETAYEGPGISGSRNLLDQYPLEETGDRVLKRALLMLTAQEAPVGRMPVVLLGEAGGTMIHEACGHALEADFVHKETSIFRGQLGKKVASDCVTVVDDGSLPGLYGSYTVDDEGVPATRTVLIDRGVLTNYMTDRVSANMLGLPLSGNGRRESYRSKPVPRMSNTFIDKGPHRTDDILKDTERGLLVKRMGGGQVNITNGDFIFEVMEGYLIEKGKITKPVRGASLIGNGPEVLKIIDRVGDDKYFIPGVCGKYDAVPVSDAQPTLRIPELTIGGRAAT